MVGCFGQKLAHVPNGGMRQVKEDVGPSLVQPCTQGDNGKVSLWQGKRGAGNTETIPPASQNGKEMPPRFCFRLLESRQ